MVIGCDVDGCLASFEHGYVPLLTSESGIQFPGLGKPDWPKEWDYELAAGVTKPQMRVVWDKIKANPHFWLDLPAHTGAHAFLQWLSFRQKDDIYFITDRMGVQAKWQTERWLKWYGYQGTPTVLLTKHKGLACHALSVNMYIDDRRDNCIDVLNTSIETICFMLKRPYNSALINPYCIRGDLDGFRKLIEEAR